MSTITLNVASLRDERAPLSHTYHSQINPQPAYVEMTEGGEVSADWSGEIGNSTPAYVWHGRTLQFAVQHNISGEALADYLESDEGRARMQAIHDGHDVQWDGSNYCGRLNDEAQAAVERLEADLAGLDTVEIYTAAEWFENSPLLELWSSGTAAAAAKTLRDETDINIDAHQHLNASVIDIEEYLIELAAGLADASLRYDEAMINNAHLDALIDAGRVTDDEATELRDLFSAA
jgi:hypothetical protein